MSVSDVEREMDLGPADRLPPQDVSAEKSVLGSMMLSKDAISDCAEGLRAGDFYRPAHEMIYDAIADLFGRGEPVDAITVADELTKRGQLQRVGGHAYIHDLIQAVPTSANAAYYAEIVAERAVLRRLVDAGTRIVQMGYAQEGDVVDVVNAAQAEVYAVADKRGSEDYAPLSELLEATLHEIEVASGRSDEMTGVPTGFIDLDELTHGLHPGQMIVIAARPAVGKALALDTPLPTPTGWTTMGEVQVGDLLLDAQGRPTEVVAATEVMTGRECYEVEFSDGSVIIADADHQWLTDTRASRRSFQAARDRRNRTKNQCTLPAVRTTAEIAATLRTKTADRRLNHSVRLAEPMQLPEQPLPLSPYVLGAWLGDGTTDAAQITTADPEIVMFLEAEGLEVVPTAGVMRYSLRFPKPLVAERSCVVCGSAFLPQTSQVRTCGRVCGGRSRGLTPPRLATCPDCGRPSSGLRQCAACRESHGTVRAVLRGLGILGNKHVPHQYLRASEAQRRALLAGLLDTDGTVTAGGCPQFTTTSPALMEGVRELIVSLGYRCGVSRKAVAGRSVESSTAYTLTFSADEDVFRLPRKVLLHKEKRARRFQRRNSRFITDVRPIPTVPVRCVEVDNEEHLYLAGRSMIPTHNSTIGLDIARAAAIKHGMATAVFSLEMSKTEITMRVLSAEASLQLQDLRKGTLRDEGWQKLARVMGDISVAPLYIDDSPNMTLMEIRAKCRRLKQLHNLKLVVIDYLQLMTSGKKVESRQQEVSEFSRAIKLLAKELDVPVIAISQLNRGPEQRTDKRPQMSDLRESGCLPADTRILRADTGAETTIGELYASGAKDIEVWSLDDGLRYRKRTMTHVFSTGTAPVFRLTLASGKTVRATENHPLFTYDGWQPLASLRRGDRIAVPRHVPSPRFVTEWTCEEVTGAARLSAIAGLPVPTEAFSLPKAQIARFLQEMYAVAGSVRDSGGDLGCVHLTMLSRQVVEAVARLLLRFGISSRLDDGELIVDHGDSIRRLCQEIGISDPAAAGLLAKVKAVQAASIETKVLEDLGDIMAGESVTRSVLAGASHAAEAGTVAIAESPSSARPALLAELLSSADIELSAINDVEWDTVVDVEPAGVEEVFDATVLGSHNFVADGISVHNSIEQDADMVILLHRDRDPEPGKEGEADVIVAKHRNGPTRDITLAFQGHYSRFTNMVQNY